MKDIAACYRKYWQFSGRARRREFWLYWLFINVVSFIIIFAGTATGSVNNPEGFARYAPFVYAVWLLLNLLPYLAVSVRRLHDTDRSGWWFLIVFIPFGGLVFLVFAVQKGTAGPNRYGDDPLQAAMPKTVSEPLWQKSPPDNGNSDREVRPGPQIPIESPNVVLPEKVKAPAGNHRPTEYMPEAAPADRPQAAAATRLVGPADLKASARTPVTAGDDPVVGWVVVVNGPGRGYWRQLGSGVNDIGRSSSARVCLDYGDETISRDRHATITFDPRGLKFYIQQGEGKNLTYVDEVPVLAPQELSSGQKITLGATQLRFVALCGPDFAW